MKGGELDSGDIIVREYKSLDVNTRISQIYDWFEEKVPPMINEAVKLLEKDPSYVLEKQSSDPKDALRCYPRIPDDGRIQWNEDAETVVRLVNASSEPYAGAFCFVNGEKITIWRAEIFHDNENYLAVPGQVASINSKDGSIIVIAGNGKIRITEAELSGKRGVPAEFIKSIRTRLV
jgi:methionyl-tRNA formyltransferase